MSPTAPAPPSGPPMLFGRYQVSAQLGETRLATVYAATDVRLQRSVLLHLLRKELVGQERPQARFVAEISQMARRSHQALLEVFDSGQVADRPFVVTEHCVGRPLYGLGLLTVEQALLYVRQVTGAVATCQAQRSPELPIGLYHPPISSSMVLLVDEGRVKLVDSWLLPSSEVVADLAHYRAPELSEGQAATPATAVYALGLMLFELITGERPIQGSDARATALAHLTAHIAPLHQTRAGLYLPTAQSLLDRATARLPEQRYVDARSFGEALDGLWRELGATTQRLAPTQGRGRPGRSVSSTATARPATLVPTTEPQPVVPAGSAQPTAPADEPVQRGMDPNVLRWRTLTRNLVGWLVMVGLVLTVAMASYLAVHALIARVGSLPRPSVPGLPALPVVEGGPQDWFNSLFKHDEAIYIVNIAEGLNLRREPNATDATNVIAVVANGMPVRKLEGPRIEDNIPWLRVRAEIDGKPVEGWMSLNYLLPKE